VPAPGRGLAVPAPRHVQRQQATQRQCRLGDQHRPGRTRSPQPARQHNVGDDIDRDHQPREDHVEHAEIARDQEVRQTAVEEHQRQCGREDVQRRHRAREARPEDPPRHDPGSDRQHSGGQDAGCRQTRRDAPLRSPQPLARETEVARELREHRRHHDHRQGLRDVVELTGRAIGADLGVAGEGA